MKTTFEKKKLFSPIKRNNTKQLLRNIFQFKEKKLLERKSEIFVWILTTKDRDPSKAAAAHPHFPFQAPAYTWSQFCLLSLFFFFIKTRTSLNYDTTRAQNPTAAQHVQSDTNRKNCPVNVQWSLRLHRSNPSLSFHAHSVIVLPSLASDI